MWTPNPKTGWQAGEDPPTSILRHVLHTVLQVVPGGVIRAGKQGYDDDARAGFWLGTGSDGIPRFSLGGPRHALRWTGETLEITGWFSTPTVTIDDDGLAIVQGDELANQLRFVNDADETLGLLEVTGDWGRWLILETTQPAALDEVGRLDLAVDGDWGANVRLRLETTKSRGPSSSFAKLMIGNETKFRVDSAGLVQGYGGFDAMHNRVRFVADAEEEGDALNRRTGDGRYLVRSGGWSGQIPIGATTLTVEDGQIVGVG